MKTTISSLLVSLLALVWNANAAYAQQQETTQKPEKEVYTFAEQMPEFPGGTEKMYKYLSSNINYPKACKEKGIEGKVILSFIVGEEGSLTELKPMNQSDPLLEQEAIRVVSIMPKWTPGKQNGKPVSVRYTLPIRFQLK